MRENVNDDELKARYFDCNFIRVCLQFLTDFFSLSIQIRKTQKSQFNFKYTIVIINNKPRQYFVSIVKTHFYMPDKMT